VTLPLPLNLNRHLNQTLTPTMTTPNNLTPEQTQLLLDARQQDARNRYFDAQSLYAACADVHRALAVNPRANAHLLQRIKEAHRLSLLSLQRAKWHAESVGLRFDIEPFNA
jgi:hypothetical protein